MPFAPRSATPRLAVVGRENMLGQSSVAGLYEPDSDPNLCKGQCPNGQYLAGVVVVASDGAPVSPYRCEL